MLKKDKKSLIHSAIWYAPSGVGDPVFDDEQTVSRKLEHVRFSETSRKAIFSAEGASDGREILLFYFVNQSTCDGSFLLPSFGIGDRIEIATPESMPPYSDMFGLYHQGRAAMYWGAQPVGEMTGVTPPRGALVIKGVREVSDGKGLHHLEVTLE